MLAFVSFNEDHVSVLEVAVRPDFDPFVVVEDEVLDGGATLEDEVRERLQRVAGQKRVRMGPIAAIGVGKTNLKTFNRDFFQS